MRSSSCEVALVASDHAFAPNLNQALLQQGYQVVVAAGVEQAQRLLDELTPCIVVAGPFRNRSDWLTFLRALDGLDERVFLINELAELVTLAQKLSPPLP